MAELEAFQKAIIQAAIQVATAAVMVIRGTHWAHIRQNTSSLGEAHKDMADQL